MKGRKIAARILALLGILYLLDLIMGTVLNGAPVTAQPFKIIAIIALFAIAYFLGRKAPEPAKPA